MTFIPPGIKKIDSLIFNINKDLIGSRGIHYQKLLKDWNFIIGLELASSTAPIRISKQKHKNVLKNILSIAVNNSSLITELVYQTGMIIEKVNFYFGYEYINDVKFSYSNFKSIRVDKVIETSITAEQEEKIENLTLLYPEEDNIKAALKLIAKELITRN